MEDKQNQPKGALVLVFAFLVWFAIYYFTNWWLLGRTWFIRSAELSFENLPGVRHLGQVQISRTGNSTK